VPIYEEVSIGQVQTARDMPRPHAGTGLRFLPCKTSRRAGVDELHARLQLALEPPDAEKLERIVEAHLGVQASAFKGLIDEFLTRKSEGELATDELLNAIFLRYSGLRPQTETVEQLADIVMPYLDKAPG